MEFSAKRFFFWRVGDPGPMVVLYDEGAKSVERRNTSISPAMFSSHLDPGPGLGSIGPLRLHAGNAHLFSVTQLNMKAGNMRRQLKHARSNSRVD